MNHRPLILTPRPTDWIFGANSPISFKAVSNDWQSHFNFFEHQKLADGDDDDCWDYTAQESLDAQFDVLLANADPALSAWLDSAGYMDIGTDGRKHFHSSPRFAGVLSGDGTAGGRITDAWDVFRKYGCAPWTLLPAPDSMTLEEYFAPIPQNVMDVASEFLFRVGGKDFAQYHWLAQGKENMTQMAAQLPQSPLCLGVNVGPDWNVQNPPAPSPSDPPGHVVAATTIDAQGNIVIFDHYQPNPKTLLAGYPVNWCLQGVVTLPATMPIPAPVASPAPSLPPNPTVPQLQTWLASLTVWLKNVLSSLQGKVNGVFKGRAKENKT